MYFQFEIAILFDNRTSTYLCFEHFRINYRNANFVYCILVNEKNHMKNYLSEITLVSQRTDQIIFNKITQHKTGQKSFSLLHALCSFRFHSVILRN